MPLITTEAFVLRTYKLAEQDKLVVLFTRDLGKVRLVAKGARKLRNRFGAALEVFTHLRVIFHERENKDLLVLDRAEILYSPFEKQTQLRTSYALFYFAELFNEFFPEREKNTAAFRMMLNVHRALQNQQNLNFLARYIELQLLHSQGILSSVASCSQCNSRFESLQEKRYLGSGTEILCRRCRSTENTALSTQIIKSIDAFEQGSSDWVSSLEGSAMEELRSLNHLLITRFLGKDLQSYRFRKQFLWS